MTATRSPGPAVPSESGRPRPWAGAGSLALVVCTWLLLAQWGFHPVAETGPATAARGIVVALVVALPAVRLLMGPHRASALLVAAGGAVLMASAAIFQHLSVGTAVSEAACGLLLLTAGIAGAVPVQDRGTKPFHEAGG